MIPKKNFMDGGSSQEEKEGENISRKGEEGTVTLKEETLAEQQNKSGLGILGFKKQVSKSFKKELQGG